MARATQLAALAAVLFASPWAASATQPTYYYYYYQDGGDNATGHGAQAAYTALPPEAAAYGAQDEAQYYYYYYYDDNAGGHGTHASQAAFQNLDEIPPLPGEDEIDITPPGVGGDVPTFGEQQERAYQEVIEAAPMQFLRAQSVLLDHGERQIDVGWQYAINEGFILVPQLIGPDQEQVVSTLRVRQRLMLIPLEIRYGVTNNLQWFVNLPVGWANTEVAIPGFDDFSNKVGLGDLSTGFSKLLHQGCGYGPDVICTVSMIAPTGRTDFPVLPTVPAARLGQGYWGASASLLCIHTLDPVVVFYGGGYLHRFNGDFQGGTIRVNPGEMFVYQFGVGFGANESVVLSTSFLGQYIVEDRVNGQRVQGGILEPMRLRFAATIARPCKIVEPFAEVGMTNDALSSRIGITITH